MSDQLSGIPRPDMGQLISVFGMQSLMACGKLMNPVSRKFEIDLPMAQYQIGVLEVLLEKTKGNLTSEEQQALENVLYQSRMAFLDASRGGPVPVVETSGPEPEPPRES